MEYPVRKSHRLKNWDYSQYGYYYVTICTQDKRKLLCDILGNELETQMYPTAIGQIVRENWEALSRIYPNVKTDYFCVMPNHIHGILILEQQIGQSQASLSQIVRGFKSVTTRAYNRLVPETEKNTLWQSSYYDTVIRDDAMLKNIRNYIFGNPSKWLEDELYIK